MSDYYCADIFDIHYYNNYKYTISSPKISGFLQFDIFKLYFFTVYYSYFCGSKYYMFKDFDIFSIYIDKITLFSVLVVFYCDIKSVNFEFCDCGVKVILKFGEKEITIFNSYDKIVNNVRHKINNIWDVVKQYR